MTTTRPGPGGYSRPPYGSFAGKPQSSADSRTFVRNFTVLGLGGYSRPLWASFAGRLPAAVVVPPRVGWPGHRIKREELERRLKEQRDNTFGRRRWAELKALEAAEEAASRLALETASKAQRKALEAAAQAARDTARVASEAQSLPVQAIDALTLALEAATSATRVKVSLDEAKRAIGLANAVMAELRRIEDENDEEEAIVLLLTH